MSFVLKEPYGLVPPTCLAYTNASGRVMVVDIIFAPPKIEPEILKNVGKREHNH